MKQQQKTANILKKSNRKQVVHWKAHEIRKFNIFLLKNLNQFYVKTKTRKLHFRDTSNYRICQQIRVRKNKFNEMADYLQQYNIDRSNQQCKTHFDRSIKENKFINGDIQVYFKIQYQQDNEFLQKIKEDLEKQNMPIQDTIREFMYNLEMSKLRSQNKIDIIDEYLNLNE